jgi:uncharacterized membrane protein
MRLTSLLRGLPANGVGFARGLFALAGAGLALWILTFGQWVPQPLPTAAPLREILVYGAAVVILVASAGICLARTAAASVVTLAAYLALSAVLAVPRWLFRPLSVDAWYPFCEALTPLAAAGALYVMLRRPTGPHGGALGARGILRAAQVLFGLTCIFYGGSHFAYAAYTATLVPAWLPERLPIAYVTGACHVAAGLAVIVGFVPRLAAMLEATMMSLFGLMVWVPSLFAQPRPSWATPPAQQWSELVVTVMLAAAAWVVAISLSGERSAEACRSRTPDR